MKNEIEKDLDNLYSDILKTLDYILIMCGLEKDFINKQLDNDILLQSELDSGLMELIETIRDYYRK